MGIPAKANRKERCSWDREACKWRHPMENCLARIKEYRCIAPRYDKTASSFKASEARERDDITELRSENQANNRVLNEKLDRLVEGLLAARQP